MNVCMALAEGFEEIEAISVLDILRRANISVETFSISGNSVVEGAHGISVVADKIFEQVEFKGVDMLILPGGQPGTNNLKQHEGLGLAIKYLNERKKWLAAICAAPTVLGKYQILNGRNAVCYPGCEEELSGAKVGSENVVVDEHVVTSRGPATAMEFGFKLVELIRGTDTSIALRKGMLA